MSTCDDVKTWSCGAAISRAADREGQQFLQPRGERGHAPRDFCRRTAPRNLRPEGTHTERLAPVRQNKYSTSAAPAASKRPAGELCFGFDSNNRTSDRNIRKDRR